jgi:rhodanese-related sulfurtransferase
MSIPQSATLLLLLTMTLIPPAGLADGPAATITPDLLIERQLVEGPDLVVLDVRNATEYAAGHVPGAVNVPHDQIETRLDELAGLRDKDVVVYCHTGRRAALAVETLTHHGFTRLEHLAGDMQAWTADHRPVEQSPAAEAPAPPATPPHPP